MNPMHAIAAPLRLPVALALAVLLLAYGALVALVASQRPQPQPHAHSITLKGWTSRHERVQLDMRGGRVGGFAIERVPVTCSSGYRFLASAAPGAVALQQQRSQFALSEHARLAYPDGQTASVTEALVSGSVGGATRASGTARLTVRIYRSGAVTDVCGAGPERFSAR